MSSTSACARVLALPELLEAIIINLSIRKILDAQRVSQAWLDNISESTPIQRKLFLKPTGPPVAPNLDGDGPHYGHINTNDLLLHRSTFRKTPTPFVSSQQPEPRYVRLSGWILQGTDVATKVGKETCEDFLRGDVVVGSDRSVPPWRMFLTQPPCTVVEVEISVRLKNKSKSPFAVRCSVRNGEGLRWGDIIKAAESMFRSVNGMQVLSGFLLGVGFHASLNDEEIRRFEMGTKHRAIKA